MSYIVVVNPAILKAAGVPAGPSMVATILTAVFGTLLRAGHLTAAPVLVAIFGFLLMAVLMIRRFPAAILIGILATAFLAYVTGVAVPPKAWVSLPPSISPILFSMDFRGALSWRFFPIVLPIFIM